MLWSMIRLLESKQLGCYVFHHLPAMSGAWLTNIRSFKKKLVLKFHLDLIFNIILVSEVTNTFLTPFSVTIAYSTKMKFQNPASLVARVGHASPVGGKGDVDEHFPSPKRQSLTS